MHFRNVRLMRPSSTLRIIGIQCLSFSWVGGCITRTSPCASKMLSLITFVGFLDLNCIFLLAPKLKDTIGELAHISFSSSLCHPILSRPFRYQLANTEFNDSEKDVSSSDRMHVNVSVHSFDASGIPEYPKSVPSSPYQAFNLGIKCSFPNNRMVSCVHSSSVFNAAYHSSAF